MASTYWVCKNRGCERPFKVKLLPTRYINKGRDSKPFCPFCGKALTYKSCKELHDAYHKKQDVERSKAILKSLDVWYNGGTKSFLEKGDKNDILSSD